MRDCASEMNESNDEAIKVVKRRRNPARRGKQESARQVRWSVADFRIHDVKVTGLNGNLEESNRRKQDRQSICLTGGFLSLSPAGRSNKWRHSYACGEDERALTAYRDQQTNSLLYSICEEENASGQHGNLMATKAQRVRQVRLTAKAGMAMAPHLALSPSS